MSAKGLTPANKAVCVREQPILAPELFRRHRKNPNEGSPVLSLWRAPTKEPP